jgi:hypothetical protein
MIGFTLNTARRWRALLPGAAALVLLLGALCVAPRVLATQGVSYTFVNQSSWTIRYLHMSSSSVQDWGPDRLGSSVLPTGRSFTVYGLRPGNYDIKTIDEDGDQCIRMRVPVFRNTRWVMTSDSLLACERATAVGPTFGSGNGNGGIVPRATYTFVNRSRWTIRNIYMSSSSVSEWGPDRLGSSVLAPGQTFSVSNIVPGTYDIRTVDQDGDECRRMRVAII